MSFGKPVNSRTLADVNRANAEFHAPVKDAQHDEETHARKQYIASEERIQKGMERIAKRKAEGRDPATGSKSSKDISHENGKQVIKQKGQVVVQHDEDDSSPMTRVLRKEGNKSKFSQQSEVGQRKLAAGFIKGGTRAGKKEAKAQLLNSNSGRRLHDADSFSATDKTISDVNAANARFHSADSEDAEYKSNFNSPNERPPYLEEIPAKKKAAPPAKSVKDDEDEAWFQDPAKGKQTGKEAAEGLRGAEIVRTRKGGEEIRNPGKYEGGDYSSKRYAPKASAFHGDAFPATDKTLASINDANLQYYNNSPHAGNAQDAEPKQPSAEHKEKNGYGKGMPDIGGRAPATQLTGIKRGGVASHVINGIKHEVKYSQKSGHYHYTGNYEI